MRVNATLICYIISLASLPCAAPSRFTTRDQNFVEAVKRKDIQSVKSFIQSRVFRKISFCAVDRALVEATNNNDHKMMTCLIEKTPGFGIQAMDRVLVDASKYLNHETLGILLSAGPKLNFSPDAATEALLQA